MKIFKTKLIRVVEMYDFTKFGDVADDSYT